LPGYEERIEWATDAYKNFRVKTQMDIFRYCIYALEVDVEMDGEETGRSPVALCS
jgi:hypothetical protein